MRYLLFIILILTCTLNVQATKIINLDTNKIQAYTDGEDIYISTGMKNLLKKEEYILFVIAHEASHIKLQHPKKTQDALYNTCLFSRDITLCKKLFEVSYSVQNKRQEMEADTMALKYMKSKGYTQTVCNNFDLFAKVFGDDYSNTHPYFYERKANCLKIMNS